MNEIKEKRTVKGIENKKKTKKQKQKKFLMSHGVVG